MDIYSVTPPADGDEFVQELRTVATASEQAGWTGILLPHNLHDVDPWLVSGHIGAITGRLAPLLALQPACTPPHLAAACAAAFATLYGRPMHFNLVAGAREDEMHSIGDDLSHDKRYERLREYGTVLRKLLRGETVDHCSAHYTYRSLTLKPRPDILSQCRMFMAGSSPASRSVGAEIADVVVTHPLPFEDWWREFAEPLRSAGYHGELGVRIGVICRPTREEAWQLAKLRFPQTWIGRQETLLKTRSQNVWSRDLAQQAVNRGPDAADPAESGDPYWLGAFASGQASAPFLVGSYEEVTEKLSQYTSHGVGSVLLNGCETDDFRHIRHMVDMLAG